MANAGRARHRRPSDACVRERVSGRLPKQDSRADEIRERLLAWEEEPESARPSLRSLARDLGTSHQLLNHYLEGLGVWQAKRQCEEYCRLKDEIEAREKAEHRWCTAQEDPRVGIYGRKWVDQMLVVAMEKTLSRWRRQARKKNLTTKQIKVLDGLASMGHKGARKILQNLSGAEKIKSKK